MWQRNEVVRSMKPSICLYRNERKWPQEKGRNRKYGRNKIQVNCVNDTRGCAKEEAERGYTNRIMKE